MVNNYKIKDDFVIMYLSNRSSDIYETYIDIDDLETKLLNYDYSWHLFWSVTTKANYVKSTKYLGLFDGKPKYQTIYLHRFLLNVLDEDLYIDHINHNTLDNRKSNLKIVTNIENHKNRRNKANSGSKTGVRNVSYSELYKKFKVQFWDGHKNIPYGMYETLEKATETANKFRHIYQCPFPENFKK